MRLLLDTHCWLWWLEKPERLNVEALSLIADRRNTVYLSAASAWEIAIKVSIGKLELPEPPASYVPSRLSREGMSALPVQHYHAVQVAELPRLHNDPFDRLLVAQANVEQMPLLTADPQIVEYAVPVIWAGLHAAP